MSILTAATLEAELPSGADVTSSLLSEIDSFVNNSTSNKYDKWDDATLSPEIEQVPYEIIRIAKEVGKAMYYLSVCQTSREGAEYKFWTDSLTAKKKELKEIQILPVWYEQVVSLDLLTSSMLVGPGVSDAKFNGLFHRVIPFNAQIESDHGAIWTYGYKWKIRKAYYADEYPLAWYLDCQSSSDVEGTLKYMRTFRNDGADYLKYKE